MNKKYYEKQIKGLMIILEDNAESHGSMVQRSYVIEKMKMILDRGINFNPSILNKLEKTD